MSDAPFEAGLDAWLARLIDPPYSLAPLEAVVLARLLVAERGLTSGRIARDLELEHALVRRAADALAEKGWIEVDRGRERSAQLNLSLAPAGQALRLA
ncbi:MarR family transcriptional regulator [Halotalea alkalilenta]|uniref:MarR family transcriptional regulator n=1 Tax=Halotalea alkalilenta TaxID=376489 RepID=UPI000484EFB4|nr:MarR family transcriptional regulator [Halotalea alkalilenta]